MAFPNKVRARCAKCGCAVEVGTGMSDKASGRWVTTHDSCPPTRAYSYWRFEDDHSEADDAFSFSGVHMRPVDWQEALNPDEGDKA